MNNKDHIKYTYIHQQIIVFLAKKYIKENKEEICEKLKYHDLDKLFMYLFYDKKDVSRIHRSLSKHHDNSIEKEYSDYVEMVLDWESARYTKPDKPLNAYDTLYKYFPNMEEHILPILKEFSIDKSNLPMENDVIKYVESIKNASFDDIKKEMINFINKKIS